MSNPLVNILRSNRARAGSQPKKISEFDPLNSYEIDEAETIEHMTKFKDYLKLMFIDLISKDSGNKRSSISQKSFIKVSNSS